MVKVDDRKFGELIKKYRTQKRISQHTLGMMTDTFGSNICNYEKGDMAIPPYRRAIFIYKLGIPLTELPTSILDDLNERYSMYKKILG